MAHDDVDDSPRIGFQQSDDVLANRGDQVAIGGGNDDQLPFADVLLPFGLGRGRLLLVDANVNGVPRVAHRLGEVDHLHRAHVDAVNQQHSDDPVGLYQRLLVLLHTQRLGHVFVMVVDAKEQEDQRRHQQQDEPGAGGELGDGEDGHDHEGRDRADGADNHVQTPMGVVFQHRLQPLDRLARLQLADLAQPHNHARLRHGEAEEDANGVERDEGCRAGAHHDDQHRSGQGQGHDAPGEDKPAAAIGELTRQEAVTSVQGRQPWEVGEAGVGGHQKHQGRAGDEHQVGDAARAIDRPRHLGDDRLVVGRNGLDMARQDGDAQEKDDQQRTHDHQRARGVAAARLLEGGYTVGDGLDAGQGCRAATESAQDEKESQRRGRVLQHLDPSDDPQRARGPAVEADGQRYKHHAQEEVGRHGEDRAALAHATQVDDGHERDDADSDDDPVGGQVGKGGHDLGHAGGDGHGHGQDVVGQQRRAGHLGGHFAQVVAGDDVGSTAVGVGEDRLPVADGDDDQEDSNSCGNGQRQAEVGQRAGQGQDDQNFFGGIGGRRDGIRGEDGQSDLFADDLVGQ